MTPEDWDSVRKLFHEALDRPPLERASFLQKECVDPGIRAEVEELLANTDDANDPLSSPAVEGAREAIEAAFGKPKAGSRIDHYEILRELGHGGMGKVYLARDLSLDRLVAIKVVSLEVAATEKERKEREAFTERLIREAKISAALDHSGIVTIHQVGLFEKQPYIVMQFIDGPTLESLLAQGTKLAHGEISRILKEAAGALDHAHDSGVIHRDIKPPNIMLTRSHSVKICDFGVAKSAALSHKTSGLLMGTPYYMAPEQLTFKPVDRRTDQWALGIVAYQMLAGRLPFEAGDLTSLASQIVHQPMPPLQNFDSTLAPRVTEVLRKALSKDPAGRYATCSEFAADVAAALGGTIRTAAPSPVAAARPVASWVWWSAGAFAIGATVIGLVYEQGRHRLPAPSPISLRAADPDGTATAPERGVAAAKATTGLQRQNAHPVVAQGSNPRAAANPGVTRKEEADSIPSENPSGNRSSMAKADVKPEPKGLDPLGMTKRGYMYEKGLGGLPRDYNQAVNWYRKGAEAGDPSGMNALGIMYENGWGGLPKDEVQAASWYRKGALAGNPRGMTNLGHMYQHGLGGLPQDYGEAVSWYRKAADAGQPVGMTNLGDLYRRGVGGLPKDDVQATGWYQKAADAGEPRAMTYLGTRYETGSGGLPKDLTEAASWYRKAADLGDADGMNGVGMMYKNGWGGLPKDDSEAVNWWRKAAAGGSAAGATNLGYMYENGWGGLPKDDVQAVSWYRKAAESGRMKAMVYLGAMYESGRGGLSKDEIQAAFWYRKAANLGDHDAQAALARMGLK